MEWYNKSIEAVLSELDTDQYMGLKEQEPEQRLLKYGKNELRAQAKKTFAQKLIDQFKDFLIIILIVAAIISAAVGEVQDSIVILAIVVLNAIMGIVQEGKAEKSVEALQKMSAPEAKVIRNGKQSMLPSADIVPGDIVILEAGDIIPADVRLIESSNMKVEEASLTGESVPVDKNAYEIIEGTTGIGDRHNMGFSSTVITYGRGKGLVVETGEKTEIGHIATTIQSYEEEETPLQQKLNQLGKVLGNACILICIVVFGVGLIQGRGVLNMLLTSISLAVAAIPEGLPAIVTIVLSIGMNRMATRNAIVKKLLAVETLGATQVICSDKTGTLTQNQMTVVKAYVDDKIIDVEGSGYDPSGAVKLDGKEINLDSLPDLKVFAFGGTLANDAYLDNSAGVWKMVGDPTEGAIVTFTGKLGKTRQELNAAYPRIEELPFDSDRKMMSTFHKNYIAGKVVSFTKGAPDIVIKRCTKIALNGEVVDFTDELKKRVLSVNIQFARKALRVLSVAYKVWDEVPANNVTEVVEAEMIFLGLVGMIDPARPEVKAAIEECKNAGITAVMITGDYKETAFAIAKDLGMAEIEDQAMMGAELDGLTDEEIREVVKKTRVYARVSPDHKVKIVTALRENGNVTAMTGDGVNDAMALKKADIGISMGITGTDVAKNTADVILTDDNFATIVNAVEEGRIIFSNIKKFVFFLLSCNIGEILIVFVSILIGWEMPLVPIQLLWLNLVTDSFPALALGVEPAEPNIMSLPPRNTKEGILDKAMYGGIIFQAIAISCTTLLSYYWAMRIYGVETHLAHIRTIVMVTLITAELLRSFSSRSQVFTLFKIGFFTNKTMNLSVLGAFILTVVVVYLPVAANLFNLEPLSFNDWEIVMTFSFIPLVVGELYKKDIQKSLSMLNEVRGRGAIFMLNQTMIREEVSTLVKRASINISSDTKKLLKDALEKESNDTAKSMLSAMIENSELAAKQTKPVCQSPGYPTLYISFGNETLPGFVSEMFQKSIIDATNVGLLRPSMVHPLTRENSGDNSGYGVPNIEYDYIPNQDYLEMIISFKGCGAELGNALKIFTVEQLGKDYVGLKRFVLETVVNAGGKPCPPYGIGIGIGGQMDVACKLSRKAISTRLWDDENPDDLYNKLEKDLYEEINSLGIGAAGTGGDTVALAVKILGSHTHTAIAPVAINFHCWVTRRAGIRIYLDGRKEMIF